jgi:hypothetical protein
MSQSEAEYWASQLLPQSLGVYWSQTTYAAWRYIPTTYVLCGRDQAITLPYGEMILKAAQDSKPNMIDFVERCDVAGHCVMLSQVQVCAVRFFKLFYLLLSKHVVSLSSLQ